MFYFLYSRQDERKTQKERERERNRWVVIIVIKAASTTKKQRSRRKREWSLKRTWQFSPSCFLLVRGLTLNLPTFIIHLFYFTYLFFCTVCFDIVHCLWRKRNNSAREAGTDGLWDLGRILCAPSNSSLQLKWWRGRMLNAGKWAKGNNISLLTNGP